LGVEHLGKRVFLSWKNVAPLDDDDDVIYFLKCPFSIGGDSDSVHHNVAWPLKIFGMG
jgi:hypothetical protein